MAHIIRLPNGVRAVHEGRPGTGTVSMSVTVTRGLADDSADQAGLTYLTQEATNTGTATKSGEQIAEEIAAMGGGLTTSAYRTFTEFSTAVPARHAEAAFALVSDVLLHPALDAQDIQRTKKQIKAWIKEGKQQPSTRATQGFMEQVFAGQTVGGNTLGTPELLDSFTPGQVRAKHKELLSDPSRIVISVAGDVTAEQVEQWVARNFGGLAPAAQPQEKPRISFVGGDTREATKDEQTNLRIGFKAPTMRDKDYYAAVLLQDALAGGMSTPLFQEIREKRRLAYSVSASYSAFESTGYFSVSAGVGVDEKTGASKAGTAMDVTIDLLGKVAREGFSAEDLEAARDRVVFGRSDARETAYSAMGMNTWDIVNEDRIVTVAEYKAGLDAVTSDDIRRVAANMLKDGVYALSAVGPQDTMPAPQDISEKMKAQVEGLDIPAPRAVAALAPAFAKAVAKDVEAPTLAPQITVLENGEPVITISRPGPLNTEVAVGTGSDHEHPRVNGIKHMNEHMMFQGTTSYGPGEIDRAVEGRMRASLNAYTNRDMTAYQFFNLRPAALPELTKIEGEMVMEASLKKEQFEGKTENGVHTLGEKEAVIEEIRRANDNLQRGLWDDLYTTAYPGQPHGRPVLGTKETVTAMTTEDLAEDRRQFYTPNNTVFVAVGPVSHDEHVELVRSRFGHIKSVETPPLPVPVYHGGTVSAEDGRAEMANIVLAAEGVSRVHPDIHAYNMLADLLGGGHSSRLHKDVVEGRELTGQVQAGMDTYRNAGLFLVVASAPAENVKAITGAVYTQLRDLADNITEDELNKAKTRMENGLLHEYESNAKAADLYAVNYLDHGRLVLPSEIAADIQKVTVDDMKRVARAVLASNPTLSMLVPPGTAPAHLPTHDEVLAMRDGKATQGQKPKNDPLAP